MRTFHLPLKPLLLVLALCVAVGLIGARSASPSPPRVVDGQFHSAALDGTDHFAIYLPRGYRNSGKHYPVIYLLHGLPGGADSYKSAHVRSFGQAAEEAGRPALVVAPPGARAGDSDPEWHDWGPGRDWETATAEELVAYIDGHYRTISDRRGRAMIGLSAGGYGAAIIGVHHPDVYSVIESWSGYFHPTNPEGTARLDVGSPQANREASVDTYVDELKRADARYGPTHFGFYVGGADPNFVPANERLHRELVAAGVPHVYAYYPGAHTRSFWDAHEKVWVTGAVERLQPAGP